jgi:glucose-1-phosphate thymidylyltransferase
MKGIVLAGGSGTRLYPLTIGISKQLLPVYNKPMIYYPLSTLMFAGIREMLIITTEESSGAFQALLGNGTQWGLHFEYTTQKSPRGIAEALILGQSFIGDDDLALILGDNIFYGEGLVQSLEEAANVKHGAVIFAYPVRDPERYGVIEFDRNGIALSLEEKPERPRSNYAVPGVYFYDNRAIDFARHLTPSKRDELEITDLNMVYLREGSLRVKVFSRGTAWLDAGTHESLLQAANFVQVVEERQGLMISCPEEIAYRKGYITEGQLKDLASHIPNNQYGQYLLRLSDEINTEQPDLRS